jgi:hypothetical protein
MLEGTSSTSHRVGAIAGLQAGLWSVTLLVLAAVPARLSLAIRGGTTSSMNDLGRTVAGVVVDASAVLVVVVVLTAVLTATIPIGVRGLRRPLWQRAGPLLCSLPLAAVTMVITMVAQQVRAERGAFPTAFDIMESGTNASFIEGIFGYLGYTHIWVPAVLSVVVVGVALGLVLRRRSHHVVHAWPAWGTGLVAGLGAGVLPVYLLSLALSSSSAPETLRPDSLGEPLAGLVDSSLDLLRYGADMTPRQLIVDMEPTADVHNEGAALLGWPALATGAGPHPYARALDTGAEPVTPNPRGTALLQSLERVSSTVFDGAGQPPPIVFHLLLEGFRADDVHAINPEAPRDLAPFINGLYERAGAPAGDEAGDDAAGDDAVLVGRQMYQAGVRTAQGLGAMTCGVGTLPYNLSFIRDLQPMSMRCTADVLHDAGYTMSAWYGSDISFDSMQRYLEAHHTTRVVSQKELPTDLPKGTWDAVTDFALIDAVVDGLATSHGPGMASADGPHMALLMSLSNHSPFTAPQDVPADLQARVAALLPQAPRADEEDRRRLLTFAYTDAAVERFFVGLHRAGLDRRAIVLLMADHSTGHRYVWGKGLETDAAKGQIPFAMVVPAGFRARVGNQGALDAALADAQQKLDAGPLSLNDVPSLLLAVLSKSTAVSSLPAEKRWHTMGGQVTSPFFRSIKSGAVIHAVNGVSEIVALDGQGQRIGEVESSSFLKSSADRYRLTPSLIPAASPVARVLALPPPATAGPD